MDGVNEVLNDKQIDHMERQSSVVRAIVSCETEEQKLDLIHAAILAAYGEATYLQISVNCEGINASPEYRTNLKDISMKNLKGQWVRKGGQ